MRGFRRGRALLLALGSMLAVAALAAPSAGATGAGATDVHVSGVPGQCKVRITSLATGLIVRQVDGYGLLADSTAFGTWEEFWVTDAGGGNVWLQSNGNGNYVGVYQVGQLMAAFPGQHDFARWRWEDISSVDRTFRLVSVGSGNVVRVTPDSYREVVSDNQNRDWWASFRYDKVYCL